MPTNSVLLLVFAITQGLVRGQQVGSYTPEVHPQLTIQKCTNKSGCKSQTAKLVLDANWRWLHAVGQYQNCFDNGWNANFCTDPVACATNCALEGADYQNTYGVHANGANLTLELYPSGSIGSRLYLMSDDNHYQIFKLKNQEFTFDVDVSGLPCGTNGAVYFTNMAADGGKGQYSTNQAGATYGVGYCDSQCPRDIKFINGQANLVDYSNGKGKYGTCCAEMDIWEANSAATAYTAHPCSTLGPYRCDSEGSTDCGSSGVCDQSGCDFNPYRMGNQSFYGYGDAIKTNAPNKIRVITQFITSNNKATGTLSEIRRAYIQNGQVVQNSVSKIPKVSGNSLSNKYCAAEKKAFGEDDTFTTKGGMKGMDAALKLGMVLTMSVWVDDFAHMLWLDSDYGGSNETTPGVKRGPCGTDTGNPPNVKNQYPSTQVTFSNIKYGDIGTTFGPPYV